MTTQLITAGEFNIIITAWDNEHYAMATVHRAGEKVGATEVVQFVGSEFFEIITDMLAIVRRTILN